TAAAQTTVPAVQGTTQGITDTSVKIGVAIPDILIYEKLNAAYAAGPQDKYYDELLSYWAAQGKATIAGRKIELVKRTYPAVDENAKRAACVGLVEEDK